MLEIDDYNSEQFFTMQDNWEEYQNIMDEWEEPTPQEKDFSSNIFTLEQAISVINELGNKFSTISITAEQAIGAMQKIIDIYTEYEEGEK